MSDPCLSRRLHLIILSPSIAFTRKTLSAALTAHGEDFDRSGGMKSRVLAFMHFGTKIAWGRWTREKTLHDNEN